MRHYTKLQIIETFFLIILITSCGEQDSALQNSEYVKVETPFYTVIPYDSNNIVIRRYIRNSKKAELSKLDLKKIEELLSECITKYNSNIQKKLEEGIIKLSEPTQDLNDYLISIDRYKRQYIPALNPRGEKEVWINCFCVYDKKQWKKNILTAMHGGNCHFNLMVNLTRQTCFDLEVNASGRVGK